MIFLVTDADRITIAVFFDAADAAHYCDKTDDAMYVEAIWKSAGELDPASVFWQARMDYATGEIVTETTSLYRWGSDKMPCREGATAFGRVVSQDLGGGIAWGHTEEAAVARVKKHADEGRKRAAYDAAYNAVLDSAKKSETWDPYGLWISPELKKQAIEAGEKARDSI